MKRHHNLTRQTQFPGARKSLAARQEDLFMAEHAGLGPRLIYL